MMLGVRITAAVLLGLAAAMIGDAFYTHTYSSPVVLLKIAFLCLMAGILTGIVLLLEE